MENAKLKEIEKIAREAHGNQTRRDGTEYFAHPLRVSKRVNGFIRKAAALLHDVLEDTDLTYSDLLEKINGVAPGFGNEIMGIVRAVTRDKENETYLEYLKRVKEFGPDAVKVKAADIMDNFNDEPTAVEMIKHPASLIFLAGLGDEKPTGLLKILGAGKAINLKNEKEVQKIGTNGKTIHQ